MKGQVSIEFFIYFSISLLVLSVLTNSVVNRQVETFEYRESSEINSMGSKLAFELENAQNYGEGYERGLNLSPEIGSNNYSIEVLEGFVLVGYGNSSLTIPSRYTGREFTVNPENSPFKVVNNGSVHVIPQ
jgi:hypothetical protein